MADLYYYRARYYSPKLGRFLQTDPIGTKDEITLYSYVRNDPTNMIDPGGLRCVGSGEESKCTVDLVNGDVFDREELANSDDKKDRAFLKAIERIESRLTAAYKIAQKLGESTITIKGDESKGIDSFSVSGNEIAKELGRVVDVQQRDVKSSGGEPATAAADVDVTGRIEFYNAALNLAPGPRSDYHLVEAGLHEPIHFLKGARPWDKYPEQHQAPFREAIEQVLGPRPSQ